MPNGDKGCAQKGSRGGGASNTSAETFSVRGQPGKGVLNLMAYYVRMGSTESIYDNTNSFSHTRSSGSRANNGHMQDMVSK